MSYFDERSRDWDRDPARVERALAVASAIRGQVALIPGMTALEYGCGTGLLSFALQASLGHITLADSSPGMLEVLAQKIRAGGFAHMTPLLLDLSTDPLPLERFDLIYTLMTLHHIPDATGILRNFFTLLKPGGAVCIADLDREDGSFHGSGFDGHPGFERGALGLVLENIGFCNIRSQTAYQYTRETTDTKKNYPLFLLCADKQVVERP